MSTNEEQILAWAKRTLGFASPADTLTFATNGALLVTGGTAEKHTTCKILVADATGAVQWIGVRNATGTFTFETVTPWLIGGGESGIAASMTPLSAPPKMRNGRNIARIAAIKYFMQPPSPSRRMEWLNLQVQRSESPSGEVNTQQIPLLRTMSYRDYLRSDHWATVRAEALARALYRCALCNRDMNLQVHHRTYERLGYELPSDLTVLCDECHHRFHDTLPAPPSDSPSLG